MTRPSSPISPAALDTPSVAASDGYATVPLGGFSNRWLAGADFGGHGRIGRLCPKTSVVLDSDLKEKCSAALNAETAPLRAAGATVHVSARLELENYVIQVGAISKVSGMPRQDAASLLVEVLADQEDDVWLAFQSQRIDESKQNIGGTARLRDKDRHCPCA